MNISELMNEPTRQSVEVKESLNGKFKTSVKLVLAIAQVAL